MKSRIGEEARCVLEDIDVRETPGMDGEHDALVEGEGVIDGHQHRMYSATETSRRARSRLERSTRSFVPTRRARAGAPSLRILLE